MLKSNLPSHIISLLSAFDGLSDDDKLKKIMNTGRSLAPFPMEKELSENLVPGCQSKLYIDVELDKDQNIHIKAASDALISKGLAALFIQAYSGQSIHFLFSTPPGFFSEIGLFSMISIQRQQGFLSLYKHVLKQCSHLL